MAISLSIDQNACSQFLVRYNMNQEYKNKLAEIWNGRYASSAYLYGEQPNHYLKEQLEKLPVGRILFAGEGEGRNAVYAAKRGWQVSAFDISWEGKRKALQLADKEDVHIDYHVGELDDLDYEEEKFDVIALIFTHFREEERVAIHKRLEDHLRPGGTLILEAFSRNHVQHQASNPNAGGPKDPTMLYSLEDLRKDFPQLDVLEMNEKVVELSEGILHNGWSSVIRFTGRKKAEAVD